MAVPEKGWATLAQAVAYFADERYVTTHWDAIATDDLKNKILNMAYNRIYYHPGVTVPVAGTETAAQLVKLIIIQSELAYYFALHLADEDRRKGIQAQGVVEAGIVKEKYDKDMLDKLPFPPIVEDLLVEFATGGFYAVGIERVEDDDIDEGEGT